MHREVRCCAQGRTAGRLQSKGSELGFLTPHVLFVRMFHTVHGGCLVRPGGLTEESTLCLTTVLGAENKSSGRNDHNRPCRGPSVSGACRALCTVPGTLHERGN